MWKANRILDSLAIISGIVLVLAMNGFARSSEKELSEQDKAKIRVIERVKKLGGDVRVAERKIIQVHFGPESRVRDDDLKTLDPTGEIIVLVLVGLPLTDNSLRHASTMTGLKELRLYQIPVTGSGLKYLKQRTDLYGLTLTDSQVTDKQLEHLSELKELRNLNLAGTRVTDKSMEIIGSLKHLKRLTLHDTCVTDKGLKHLDGLKNLMKLTLSNTKITGAGFEDVSLPRLEFLFLEQTQMMDQYLPYFQKFKELYILDLAYTKVTDAGLRHLESMKGLGSVIAYGTQVTKSGAEKLEAILPKCEVDYGTDPERITSSEKPNQ